MNQELGAILEHIHALSDSLITPPPRPNLSMHSLKLAVVGVPYAGSIVFSRKKKKSTHMHFHLPHTCYDLQSRFP